MKPRLLVIELWGLGDLVIASSFLQAASREFDVTLMAKPYAQDLQARFWPEVRVYPFVAPWTAFRRKYRLHSWPWRRIGQLRRLRQPRFQIGLSARWDPRDHLLLGLLGVRQRIGFPRMGSRHLLTEPLVRPAPISHRYEHWRVLAHALSLDLPPRAQPHPAASPHGEEILIHSGAGQPIRVWPIDRYHRLANRLRSQGRKVRVACDVDQRQWWLAAGETAVETPARVSELIRLIDRASIFIGNDSGPSHLAAHCGVPTFTLFGPQLPEWFAPLHPRGTWIEGKPCPYKPCSDYCRFPTPFCLLDVTEEEVWDRLASFLKANDQESQSCSPVVR